jgi:hypothetical protein
MDYSSSGHASYDAVGISIVEVGNSELVATSTYYLRICMEGLKKFTETCYNSRVSGQRFEPSTPEYRSRASPLQTCWVIWRLRQCHSAGSYSFVSHREGSGSIREQSTWDLRCTKRRWGRFVSYPASYHLLVLHKGKGKVVPVLS